MKIHLSLESSLFTPASCPAGPLAQLGDEVVLIELQGELGWEGQKEGGVVGVLGFDRPDRPTLHLGEHHLLHGKVASLPKPLAVIRRAVAPAAEGVSGAVQGDAEEEEDLDGIESAEKTPSRPTRTKGDIAKKRQKKDDDEDDDDEEEGPLFPPQPEAGPSTPQNAHTRHASSSPFPLLPPSSVKDYSSELDFSSPPPSLGKRARGDSDEDEDEDEEEDEAEKNAREKMERRRAERKAQRPERTRVYEVVAVVRKKVVFALRPEPIVTATILPT